ncbi:MAG: hypothetical protein WBC73_06030 [Phormidesmis sp.]
MPDQHALRSELGDFNSIICFRAIVTGIEDALGEKAAMIALLAAGRGRGKQLAKELSLSSLAGNFDEVAEVMNKVLGVNGTRLCIIDKIEATEAGKLSVYCRETVCSSDEPQGSTRELSYTMGAVQGALEEITGKRLRSKQVASVLRGGTHDVVELTPLG